MHLMARTNDPVAMVVRMNVVHLCRRPLYLAGFAAMAARNPTGPGGAAG
jgi:hypothetical protein